MQFAATIAIGMAAASALVSLMLALGYQPLPYRDFTRLVAFWQHVDSGANVLALSGPDLADFAEATGDEFTSIGAFANPRVWLHDSRGAVEIRACTIQTSAFRDLGIRPVLGREVREDDQPLTGGTAAPAWISYELWQARYGGSPSVIGSTIGIAGDSAGRDQVRPYIAGVLPAGASIPLPFMESSSDIWYLLPSNVADRSRKSGVFFGLARLQPGVTERQAQAALRVVTERLAQKHTSQRRKQTRAQTLESIAHDPARQTLGLLTLGVCLVILIGCANLTMLMGAEGRRRRREIAIRAALGASASRLWGEVAAEKCLLTLISLGLGALSAPLILKVLSWLIPTAGLGPPLTNPPPVRLEILLGFACFALVATLVWSTVLIRMTGREGTNRVLAGGAHYSGSSDSSPGAGSWWLALLAAQVGVGICLVAAAGLSVGAYASRSSTNLGPAPSETMLLSVSPQNNFLLSGPQAAGFNRQLLMRLERLPGTQAIALADLLPPLGFPASFQKPGDLADTERDATYPSFVSAAFFRTLGIPVLVGRSFHEADSEKAEPVAIISLDLAGRHWNSPQSAIGSQIVLKQKAYTIVGVVANFTGYWYQKPVPTIYLPVTQSANWSGYVILRSTSSQAAITALIPQVLAGMPVPAVVSNVSTMQARWQATLTRPRARMAGMLMLALLGLGLSIQGVYSLAAGTVAARRHEFAVRAALGASPSRLAFHVVRKLSFTAAVGTFAGLGAAFQLRRLFEWWMGTLAGSQITPAAVAVALLLMALAAGCYAPVRAILRQDPAETLRQG